jgi:hypothetical protein
MAPSPRIPGPLLLPPLSSLTLSSLVACHGVTATEIEVVQPDDRSEWGFSETLGDEGFERRGEIWFCGD